MYANEAQALASFLDRLRTVPRPVDVRALDMAEHLDASGGVRDKNALIGELEALAGGWLRPEGARALAGAWGRYRRSGSGDALIEEIYASRRRDGGRRLEQ